jgi:hypothetical protein
VQLDRGKSSETVRLGRGRIQLEVPPLPNGSSLSVRTPDALVVVHGTRFTVDVAGEGDGVVTTVDVLEGRVSVERAGQTAILGPGGHWSSPRTAAAPPETAPTHPAEAVETPPERQEPSRRSAPAAGSASRLADESQAGSASRLAAENRLFRAALAARRDGDLPRARALVRELLARYPTSPLAPAATREREELDRALATQKNE